MIVTTFDGCIATLNVRAGANFFQTAREAAAFRCLYNFEKVAFEFNGRAYIVTKDATAESLEVEYQLRSGYDLYSLGGV